MPDAETDTGAFLEAVAECIDREGLIPPGAGVVVGVSGGADSVALLASLRELARRPGRRWGLTAAHLNHCLRPDADDDERFVAELAARWDIPFVAERREVAAEASRTGEGIEQTARRLRYDFLLRAAENARAGRVALGHHADDNVETILYRVIRGTHLRGLAGIPVSRPLGRSGVRVVRPLLGIRRCDVEAFCRRNKLTWRTDASNADTSFRRNFIRHELLPLLRRRVSSGADEALLRLGRAAAEAEEYLAARAAEALAEARKIAPDPADAPSAPAPVVLDRTRLVGLPPLIQAYAMRIALEQAGLPMREFGADRLEELCELLSPAGPGAVSLPGNWRARRRGDRIVVEAAADTPTRPDWTVAIECPGRTALPDGRRVICELEAYDRQSFERHCRERPEGVELLDADCIVGPLVARVWREGDAFRPLGAPGRQTVSDFLTNSKVPPRRRYEVLCVADESGIVCVAPLRIDDRVRVTPATRRLLRVTLACGDHRPARRDRPV